MRLPANPEHQPIEGPVVKESPSPSKMQEVCSKTVAFVIASTEATTPLKVEFEDPDLEPVVCDPPEGEAPIARPLQIYEGKPCIQWAVEAVCKSMVSSVVVLSSETLLGEVQEAVGKADCGSVPVKVIARDFESETDATHSAAEFEIFCMTYGLLKSMQKEAMSLDESYENILVLQCDQVRVGSRHIYEVLCEAGSHPEADVIASWIQWFPRAPFVISRSFLEHLDESDLVEAGPNGHDRTLPKLTVIDHLFGEEKLAASDSAPVAVEDFLEKHADGEDDDGVSSEYDGGDAERNDGAPGSTNAITPDLKWADEFGKRCKLDFPIYSKPQFRDSLVYLDNAATTQRCFSALQTQRDYDETENANVYRGTYSLSVKSTEDFAEAHHKVEEFIGAEPGSVAFVPNTTVAINLVAQAWGMRNLDEGDVIAIALFSHHSGIVPLQIASEVTGAKIEYLPYDESGRMDRKAYSEVMGRNPKLVCFPHVGNVFGIEEPVRELVDEAHSAGARVIVDAAQSMPHIPMDVGDLGADWVAFSGHKIYGPMGIGGLWSSDEAASEMDPLMGGGGTIAYVGRQSYYLRTRPVQFELGTPAVSQAVGLGAAIDYMNALGMQNVRRHEAILTKYLVEGLHEIDGVTIIGDHSAADGQVGLVSFTMAGIDSMDIVRFLGDLNIALRGGGHCALPLHESLGLTGTVRASLGIYTTKSDIDALLENLKIYRELISER